MLISRWLPITAIVVAAACGSSTSYGGPPPPPPPGPPPPPPPPAGGHSTTITVSNNQFTPTPDTIPAGTITFNWNSGATVHNVTWLTGPGALPTNSPDHSGTETYSTTLAAGDYTYHCTHHVGMNAAIHVNP
jgi:plastocyanin